MHTCHAYACSAVVPPRMFVCRAHWSTLRKPLQDAIWREFRPGQEVDKRPSWRYLAVQQRAIAELVFKPHDEAAAALAAPYLLKSEAARWKAVSAGQGDPLAELTTTEARPV